MRYEDVKSNNDKRACESDIARAEATFSDKNLLQVEHAKSLLSVPSIYADNTYSESNIATMFETSSTSDDDPSCSDRSSLVDTDTISMILRNIKDIDQAEKTKQDDEKKMGIKLPEMTSRNSKTHDSPKPKHAFIHDLKGTIQEKLNHFSDGIKKHDILHHRREGHSSDSKQKEMFHDIRENVSGKLHQIAEKMHQFHLPHLPHHHEAQEQNLVAQAMQTILLEQLNIVEASAGFTADTSSKRKSSLQSIKQKFNLFQRPRRSLEMQSETSSLRSISEAIHSEGSEPNSSTDSSDDSYSEIKIIETLADDSSSLLELKGHDEAESFTSDESIITVLQSDNPKHCISKDDCRLSVQTFDKFIAKHDSLCNVADTNPQPLHGSLLSLSRSELLSVSPAAGKIHVRTESIGCKFSASPSKPQQQQGGSLGHEISVNIHRRSSDSDLSITPKGNSLTPAVNDRNKISTAVLKPLNQENMDMLEYPFLTLSKYPPGFIVHLGATVSARSVKLLEKAPEDMETRDSWFNELRMEIRGHAKSLGCNVILGYLESSSVCDEVTILSATGTAAVINLHYSDVIGNEDEFKILKSNPKEMLLTASVEENVQIPDDESEQKVTTVDNNGDEKTNGDDNNDMLNTSGNTSSGSTSHSQNYCSLCHIPYSRASVHVGGTNMGKCCICKRGYVPDIILATIEIPDGLGVIGTGCLITANVCRPKRDLRSESNAKEISDGLPFLEYELHRLLINKLKVKGMNAVFGLSVQVTVGEKMMALIATGTAVYLSALHPPVIPRIVAGNSWNDSAEKLAELQKSIQATVEKNREAYQLLSYHHPNMDAKLAKNFSDNDDSEGEEKLDYAIGNKRTCILEIDDVQDLELFSMLMDIASPDGIHIVNTQSVPGQDYSYDNIKNLQMFVQVWRTKIPSSHQSNSNFSKHFQRLLQSIFFKLRGSVPCSICDIKFQLDLPADEIQLLITGMVLKTAKMKSKLVQSISHERKMEDEMMFSLEEEDTISDIVSPQNKLQKKNSGSSNYAKSKHDKFVDISPLSYVPPGNGKIEKYLGNLNFFFIRESQSVRSDHNGICGFVHSFITELLAIVRANIAAMSGNMMTSFYMTELVLIDNPHKNQAQMIVNVGGDVVYISNEDT